MPRNIELKARLANLAAAQSLAERLCGGATTVLRQTDTYFHCSQGRLKLREIEGSTAHLVCYARPDQATAKASDYLITPIADAAALRESLGRALGILGVVRKVRRLYIYENVRIHLDEVEGAGCFLEFEAVLGEQIDALAGERQVEELRCRFGIREDDLLAGSYSDMLAPPPA